MTKKPNPSNAPAVQGANTAGLATYQRGSGDRIYESVMRGGGEPFGRPYEIGTPTLTERVVQFFKQRGYFGFESIDRRRRRANKFTRYGAAPFTGDYFKKR